ncbi:MAG: response regulator [Anaerolineae bacterium]|nr:response regulator [Anaerolineae bacterium]
MAKLLLIDDDDGVYKVTRLILERAGYDVLWARDGVEAISMLASPDLPDLILCDLMMPRMDGREVLIAIRQDPRLRHLPVLMLTAHRDAENLEFARDMKAVGYIVKPFRAGDLISRVRRFVEPGAEQVSSAGSHASA